MGVHAGLAVENQSKTRYGNIPDVRREVLIVDDHREFRTSARALLEAEGFTVIGTAASGSDAIPETRRLKPGAGSF